MPVSIPLEAFRRYDPFDNEVWGAPVTRADVRQALQEGRLAHAPGGQDHAARIAYLVEHPASEPVTIDVGVPSLGCVVQWPIVDGNHRLAAALYREDGSILAEVSGEVDYARCLFGESCVETLAPVVERESSLPSRNRRMPRCGVKKKTTASQSAGRPSVQAQLHR